MSRRPALPRRQPQKRLGKLSRRRAPWPLQARLPPQRQELQLLHRLWLQRVRAGRQRQHLERPRLRRPDLQRLGRERALLHRLSLRQPQHPRQLLYPARQHRREAIQARLLLSLPAASQTPQEGGKAAGSAVPSGGSSSPAKMPSPAQPKEPATTPAQGAPVAASPPADASPESPK